MQLIEFAASEQQTHCVTRKKQHTSVLGIQESA